MWAKTIALMLLTGVCLVAIAATNDNQVFVPEVGRVEQDNGHEQVLALIQGLEAEVVQRPDEALRYQARYQALYERWLLTLIGSLITLLVVAVFVWIRFQQMRALIRRLDERRPMPGELEENRQMLAEVQRIANLGSWELNLATEQIKWSNEVYRIFEVDPKGFDPSEDGFMTLVHPEDRERVAQVFAASVESREPCDIEHRLLLRDGKVKHVHVRCATYCGEDGRPLRAIGTVQDVTEHKEVERRLEAALELTEGVISAIPDILFEMDRDGHYVNVWARDPELLAAQKEMLIGRSVYEVLSPENADASMDAIRRAEESGWTEGLDLCIETGRGRRWFAHTLAKRPGGPSDQPTFLALSRDITERKLAELQLKEALEFTEGIINAIPDLLFEVDRNGRYLNIWTHTPELLAAQREALLGKTIDEALAPESTAIVMDALREAEMNGVSFGKVIRISLPQGECHFELSVSKKPGSSPTDITFRVRLEAELVESRNFLDRVLDAMPDPIFVKDRQHRWLLLNEANCKFTGIPKGALIGKSDYDVFPREEADVFWETDELVFESGEVNLNEERFTSTDGTVHYIQTKKTPFVSSDGSQMLVGVIRDITERKRYEEAHEEALNEARRLAHARSEFLAQMSHELRTPLNGILGYAQILGRDRRLDEKQRAELGVIHKSGEHLLTLINDILDFARSEVGRLELHPVDVLTERFLHTIADMVRIKAAEKGLGFVTDLAPDLPTWIRVDEKRLRQVLLNLLSNAVKFTELGQVELRAVFLPPRRLRFEVRDSGIGIAIDQMACIFEPFEQVGDRRYRAGGAGLGLAISRELVRLMGGEIGVESEPGRGSVFCFEIECPIEIGGASPILSGQTIAGYLGERRRLLAVDDISKNLAVIRDMLVPLGFEIIEARDGAQALEMTRVFAPHLILMDIVMDGMDGIEAIRRLRADPATRGLPIVVVSASVSDGDQDECLAVGADAFLPKPLDLHQLLARIGQLLQLKWEYESVEPETVAAPSAVPPAESIETLHQLAVMGDMRGIQEHADALLGSNAGYRAFCTQLRELAAAYQTRAVLAFIARYQRDEQA